MKILITTDWYKPVINGVVTSVTNLEEGLRGAGHDVRILTLSNDLHSYRKENVTFIGSIGVGVIYPNARLRGRLNDPLVQELIASGQVLPEQAHRHPRRNVITRAVGVGAKVEPDCRSMPFPLGARLLLCTDGLSNTLTDVQMHDFCRSSRDAKQICCRLIAAALSRGARDNVTALVLFR